MIEQAQFAHSPLRKVVKMQRRTPKDQDKNKLKL